MHKISVVCSLLMAFSLSALIVGCEPPKTQTKQLPKSNSGGSTTGGGTTVPKKPSKGTAETPKAAEPAPKEDAPKEGDTPKDGDAPKSSETPKDGEEKPKE